MIEMKEKTIGDSTYTVTQMTAIRAVRMQARLAKLIGPSFAAILSSANDVNPEACFPLAISMLVDKLDENTLEHLVLDLMQGVRKDGSELNKAKIDYEFSGKLNDLYKVLQFVIEVNFSDFFQEGGIIKDLIAMSQATTVSPDLKKI